VLAPDHPFCELLPHVHRPSKETMAVKPTFES
jgi:hypothetical protein